MKRFLFAFLIILPLMAGYRWIKDAEVGIRVPVILKSPSDRYTQMFRIPFINMIGPGEAVLRIKYRVLTRENTFPLNLKVSLNYHVISNFKVKDTTGYLMAPFSSTWLSKYNRLEFFLNSEGINTVRDLIELDSIWVKARVTGSKSDIFKNLDEFIEESHGKVYLIYPDSKNIKLLTSMSLFSQAIGFLYGDSVKISVTANPATIDEGGVVIIGTPMDQPYLTGLVDKLRESAGLTIVRDGRGKLIWKSIKGENISGNNGLLVFLYNNRGLPVIIVSSNSPNGVKKALSALVSEHYSKIRNYSILKGQTGDFFKMKWVAPPQGNFTFGDLGWDDIVLKGFEVDTTLRINFLPGTHFSPSSNRIILKFKPNKYLDTFSSNVIVYFNKNEIGRYTIEQLSQDVILDIPSNLLREENELIITAKLKGLTPDVEPYIKINNDSRIEIKRTWNASLPDLKHLTHFAFPFGATYGRLKTAIVLDHMSLDRFYLAIIFSRFIGLTGVINGDLILSTADSSQKLASNRNLVLIGHDFDIVSPADSSTYIEELVYPSKSVYRTFLILHGVDREQIQRIASIFKSKQSAAFLVGTKINLSSSENKYIEPLSKINLSSSGGAPFDYLTLVILAFASILVIFVIIKIWRAFV